MKCTFCGTNEAERFISIGFATAAVDLEGAAPPVTDRQGIALCVKGGCFLEFKESYWRLLRKYSKEYKKQGFPE